MYQRILVAVDGSETSQHALDAAVILARDCGAQLQPLFVVDVPILAYDSLAYDPSYVRDALLEEGSRVSQSAVALMRRAGVDGTACIVETDPAVEDIAHCILRSARKFKADVVVMGTHGRRGFQRMMLGSVAERFLRIAQCPVLLISSRCDTQPAGVTQPASDVVKEV